MTSRKEKEDDRKQNNLADHMVEEQRLTWSVAHKDHVLSALNNKEAQQTNPFFLIV